MVNPTQFDSSYAYCGQKSGHQLILPAVQREQRAIFLLNYYSIYSFFRQLGVNGVIYSTERWMRLFDGLAARKRVWPVEIDNR